MRTAPPAPAAAEQRLPCPPVCKECGAAGLTCYLAMKGNVGQPGYWLCIACWSRPMGDGQLEIRG